MVWLVSVLALAWLDGSARNVPERNVMATSDTVGKQSLMPAVDGGRPLFAEPPPDIPALRLPGRDPILPGPGAPVFGVPSTVFSSYQRAETVLGITDPTCRLNWPMLAGIGRVESNHARNGDVAADGAMVSPIFGPELNGTNGTAAIRDQSGRWARAAGPMQFLPSTWSMWGADGNTDGRENPQNVFDSSLAAGHYLCSGSGDLSTSSGLRDAILRYNHSEQYVDVVTRWINAYEHGGLPVPDQPTQGDFPTHSDEARAAWYTAPDQARNQMSPAPGAGRGSEPPPGGEPGGQGPPPDHSGGEQPPPPRGDCSGVAPAQSPCPVHGLPPLAPPPLPPPLAPVVAPVVGVANDVAGRITGPPPGSLGVPR
jgi:hypothetical protein